MKWTFGARLAVAIFVTLLLASLVAYRAVAFGPEGRIVMAAGGSAGAYKDYAQTLAPVLARNAVALDLRQDTEGFNTLKAIIDDTTGINAGIVKGGIVGSLQGRLAGAKARGWHDSYLTKLRSIGRLFHEPIWVFTRSDKPIGSLHELIGKKVMIGVKQTGSRRIAMTLLRANGVTKDNTTFIDDDLPVHAAPLKADDADAAFLVLPPEADKVQQLLRLPEIALVDFAAEAEAYVRRFPSLSKVVLNKGSVEFNPAIPAKDVTLLSTSATMVVRADMHPALVNTLTFALLSNPKSAFDRAGDPILFFKAGEFPSPQDPEFEVAPAARSLYKAGELPIVLGALAPMVAAAGLPFSVAAFAHDHGAQAILLLIPLLTVLVPLARFVPAIYNWSIRRRLLYWYRELKALERDLDRGRMEGGLSAFEEIDRIDAGVRRIKVPLEFSDQFYDLRGHIDIVRQRITAKPYVATAPIAAE